MTAPAAIKRRIASQLMAVTARSRKAPSMSSTMAPTTSTSSGSTGQRSRMTKVSFMSVSLHQHGGGLGGADRGLILRQQRRDRDRGHVEDRLREHAEQDGQDRQRPE